MDIDQKEKGVETMRGYLEGIRGGFAGARIPFEAGEVLKIGRDPRKCGLVINGTQVSREHLTIQFTGDHFRMEDTSKNGTFDLLRGRFRKGVSTHVDPGSYIQLGTGGDIFMLIVEQENAAPMTQALKGSVPAPVVQNVPAETAEQKGTLGTGAKIWIILNMVGDVLAGVAVLAAMMQISQIPFLSLIIGGKKLYASAAMALLNAGGFGYLLSTGKWPAFYTVCGLTAVGAFVSLLTGGLFGFLIGSICGGLNLLITWALAKNDMVQ